MSLEQKRWLDLADSISQGRRIDWDAAMGSATDPAEQRRLDDLEILAEIAAFHREGDAVAGSESLSELEPGTRWGPLRILGPLGRGSRGQVYRAREVRLDREVALKFLPRGEEKGFARRPGPPDHAGDAGAPGAEDDATVVEEARRLARVRHPNIASVYGAERIGGRTGFWMELIQGADLEEILGSGGPLAAEEAAVIGSHLCRALSEIHGRGLVHGDVKLRNVMRERGGRIVLLDFGLAREVGTDASGGTSEAGLLAGTPLFMAPEVLAGGAATIGSDLYSLGVLLYRLVTGAYPVEAESLAELMRAHVRGAVTPVRDRRSDLPQPLIEVLERALAKDPGHRFSSAGEMERALLKAIGSRAPDSPSLHAGPGVSWQPVAGPSGKRLARGKRISALAAIVALAIVVALAWRFSTLGAYTVNATFIRDASAGSESLAPGARIESGDALALELDTSRRLFVYVMNEDDRGAAFLLYPLPGYAPGNPLPSGRNRLPGMREGREAWWQVTSAGGREHFLVVASPRPVRPLEEAIRSLPLAERGRPITSVPLEKPTLERLRGVGGVVESPPPGARPFGAQGGRLAALARQLGSGEERVRGVWVRSVEFENP